MQDLVALADCHLQEWWQCSGSCKLRRLTNPIPTMGADRTGGLPLTNISNFSLGTVKEKNNHNLTIYSPAKINNKDVKALDKRSSWLAFAFIKLKFVRKKVKCFTVWSTKRARPELTQLSQRKLFSVLRVVFMN